MVALLFCAYVMIFTVFCIVLIHVFMLGYFSVKLQLAVKSESFFVEIFYHTLRNKQVALLYSV